MLNLFQHPHHFYIQEKVEILNQVQDDKKYIKTPLLVKQGSYI